MRLSLCTAYLLPNPQSQNIYGFGFSLLNSIIYFGLFGIRHCHISILVIPYLLLVVVVVINSVPLFC